MNGLEPAPAWRRVVARIVDVLFAFGFSFVMIVPVVILLLPAMLISDPRGDDEVWGPVGAGAAMFLAFVCLEWLLLIRRDGQTLGKGLLGLRVVRADAEDQLAALSGGRALLRLAFLLTPLVLFAAAGDSEEEGIWVTLAALGGLSYFLSLLLIAIPAARRQALHDHVALSRVVRAPKRTVSLRKDVRMALPISQVSLTKPEP